ncbi:Hypothetical predicted protein [Lecanosticta acicola]|uniref:RBR-type E3 ubiquitin transferase n=1 Tax=Lecanosticta acicola TaxID=111012 RepID=A0AAI8YXJ6_9PEZI|nr:Hypothetical predicted protein [Lecanosticta acicola]
MAATTLWMDVLEAADDETVRVINELQLQDLEDLDSWGSPDAALARQIYEDEVKQYGAIRDAEGEEIDAEGSADELDQEGEGEEEEEEEGIESGPDRAADVTNSADENGRPEHQTDQGLIAGSVAQLACNVCAEDKPESQCYRSPCEDGHIYCAGCLRRLFRTSMGDATLYPPTCCAHRIALEAVAHLLGQQLSVHFAAKQEELDDPQPLYCHDPPCSTYIGTRNRLGQRGDCPGCQKETCVQCKAALHDGECSRSGEVPQVVALAEAMGWGRCHRCPRIIERNMGCYHMTCPCGAEFCYLCSAPWKSCRCRVMDLDQIIPQAEAIAERQGQGRGGGGNNIAEIIQHLVDDPRGQSNTWHIARGEFECDGCHQRLGAYVYECLHCTVRFCYRCRCNRGHAQRYRGEIQRELRARGFVDV